MTAPAGESVDALFLPIASCTTDTLKDIAVHSKRVPKVVLPDYHSQHTIQDLELVETI